MSMSPEQVYMPWIYMPRMNQSKPQFWQLFLVNKYDLFHKIKKKILNYLIGKNNWLKLELFINWSYLFVNNNTTLLFNQNLLPPTLGLQPRPPPPFNTITHSHRATPAPWLHLNNYCRKKVISLKTVEKRNKLPVSKTLLCYKEYTEKPY